MPSSLYYIWAEGREERETKKVGTLTTYGGTIKLPSKTPKLPAATVKLNGFASKSSKWRTTRKRRYLVGRKSEPTASSSAHSLIGMDGEERNGTYR